MLGVRMLGFHDFGVVFHDPPLLAEDALRWSTTRPSFLDMLAALRHE